MIDFIVSFVWHAGMAYHSTWFFGARPEAVFETPSMTIHSLISGYRKMHTVVSLECDYKCFDGGKDDELSCTPSD